MALQEDLQSLDQPVDRSLRVGDRRPARGKQDVGLLLRDRAQAGDEVSGPRGVSVVSPRLGLRDGVLQAVKVEEFSVAVDEVACAGDALARRLEQVGYGPLRVTGCRQDADANTAGVEGIAARDGSLDPQGRRRQLGGLLPIIVEAPGFELLPERSGRGKEVLLGRGHDHRQAPGRNCIPPGMREQDAGRLRGRCAIDGRGIADQHGVPRGALLKADRRGERLGTGKRGRQGKENRVAHTGIV
jgi:hypothetical protein